MTRRYFVVLLLPLLLGCEERTPTTSATPMQVAGTLQTPPRQRAQQPKGAQPPAGLTPDDYFELGDIRSGNHVYVKGMSMQTIPFDENGGTLGLLSIECPRPDEPFGPEAQAFSREFLSSKQAWLDTPWPSRSDPASGKAYVYRCPDGAFLNAELVRTGLARVKDVGRPETVAMLRVLEEQARAAKVGIWK